jgi:L-ascorbate metabolism protein UlaG (beta-lactamase superfamily)
VTTQRSVVRFDGLLARITWIGHSTVLIELDGVRLLTDPVLRPRVLHLRRVAPPASDVNRLDALLISHGHHDHLDGRSLSLLDAQTRVVVPSAVAKRVRRRGFANVSTVDAGEEVRVGPVGIAATRAEHNPGALGYMVSGSVRIYFAGDTDLFDGMRELAGDLDVALLPIGGWGPRLPPGHLDPERAVRALQLLRPRIVVPIHWGTYTRIGLSRDEAAPGRLFADLAAEAAPDVEVRVLPVGGTLEIAARQSTPQAVAR